MQKEPKLVKPMFLPSSFGLKSPGAVVVSLRKNLLQLNPDHNHQTDSKKKKLNSKSKSKISKLKKIAIIQKSHTFHSQ